MINCILYFYISCFFQFLTCSVVEQFLHSLCHSNVFSCVLTTFNKRIWWWWCLLFQFTLINILLLCGRFVFFNFVYFCAVNNFDSVILLYIVFPVYILPKFHSTDCFTRTVALVYWWHSLWLTGAWEGNYNRKRELLRSSCMQVSSGWGVPGNTLIRNVFIWNTYCDHSIFFFEIYLF